ncbi:hypothetical protein DH86_00001232, partial [Scytalidium sp. 3C]
LVTAAPIPPYIRKNTPGGCHDSIEHSYPPAVIKSVKAQSRVSRLPKLQVLHAAPSSSTLDEEELWFDNRPVTPPPTMSREEALAMEAPLPVYYLKTLAHRLSAESQGASSAQPTKGLWPHRKLSMGTMGDVANYVKNTVEQLLSRTKAASSELIPHHFRPSPSSSSSSSSPETLSSSETTSSSSREDLRLNNLHINDNNIYVAGLTMSDEFPSSAYLFPEERGSGSGRGPRRRKGLAWNADNADLLVVVLVLSFLGLVVALEAVSRWRENREEGRIFLESTGEKDTRSLEKV